MSVAGWVGLALVAIVVVVGVWYALRAARGVVSTAPTQAQEKAADAAAEAAKAAVDASKAQAEARLPTAPKEALEAVLNDPGGPPK